jgi:catechol-2,3-dioxygenase
MPHLLGVLETSLYIEEFERACPFYEQVLGLNSIYRDQRLCAYDVGARGVLLLPARALARNRAPSRRHHPAA